MSIKYCDYKGKNRTLRSNKHILLHLLYANGFAPWNYARFLVSCSDCLLLHRVEIREKAVPKKVKEKLQDH